MQPQLAVLMTGHNRRDAVLRALDALDRQRASPEKAVLHTYFVDAGSTDGTAEAVAFAHPKVRLMRLDAEVPWGHGMRIASRNSRGADSAPFTHQLWLHPDTELHENAVRHLLTVAQEHPDAVVTGALRSPDGTRTTRSGRRGRRLALVEPTGRAEPCDTYDGGAVLLPRAVRARVGDIDRRFPYGLGDHDHGLRAHKAGAPLYVAPHHVGTAPDTPPPARPPELPAAAWCVYCLRVYCLRVRFALAWATAR
ncbi:glycosyltransferase family 2 protein [Streptomyces luteolus]|uniref:Glycosyltransferase n=1 Tax=Streptomyces luteolus TaxID=3043615 RepID=A0ABT6SXI9_9ACTN|nr:glycosyltransferase [Streptomyces sp. B-S-A12]MDI3420306.1 glycosyltransferase [Streptomyces sp. B-S-A12]